MSSVFTDFRYLKIFTLISSRTAAVTCSTVVLFMVKRMLKRGVMMMVMHHHLVLLPLTGQKSHDKTAARIARNGSQDVMIVRPSHSG